mmetsp:Transcript_19674/g.78292  ORF Transcript_19674/g.78292 Transcript_19674/m.78292 type:complete len:355 (+) Transcript_19674:15-1079(+)
MIRTTRRRECLVLATALASVSSASAANATRFVLYAHQRSGSHFVADLLTRASGGLVVARGEQVPSPVTPRGGDAALEERNEAAFTAHVLTTFEALEAHAIEKHKGPVAAIGFILQRKQLFCYEPARPAEEFVECVVKFSRWCGEHAVSVVHLVREAALMIVSSTELAHGNHTSVTRDARIAQGALQYAEDHPLVLTDRILDDIARLEFETSRERKYLKIKSAPHSYHYLEYETVALASGPRRVGALLETLAFLLVGDTSSGAANVSMLLPTADVVERAVAEDSLQELHPPTCASRVADWSTQRYRLSKATRSACSRLATLVASSSSSSEDVVPLSGGEDDPAALESWRDEVRRR